MSKASELRQMDEVELATKLRETKQELFNLRLQLATGQLDNISRLGQLRREVARTETVMSERRAGVVGGRR
jgi:large subunit ribosomal protein L29